MLKWIFPLRVLYLIYAALLFVVIMILVVPIVMIASFFGKIKGGNFIYRVCMLWGDVWFFLIGIRCRNLYEAPHDRSGHYIFVANHISYLDAPAIVKVIRQPTRVLGKVEMSKIPVFGYIYRNAIVTVDRSSPENRARSVQILKSTVEKGISIFIFPEGTFNMGKTPLKDFYDGAFKIAIETQTPIKPVLFLDTFDRMHYSSIFSLNPGLNRAVFLEEIPVTEYTLNDLEKLKQKVYDRMAERLVAYNAKWISV